MELVHSLKSAKLTPLGRSAGFFRRLRRSASTGQQLANPGDSVRHYTPVELAIPLGTVTSVMHFTQTQAAQLHTLA